MDAADRLTVTTDVDRERPSTLRKSWTSRLLAPVDENPQLDKVADQIDKWLQPLLGQPEAPQWLDLLHGRWLGHALHPVLTDVTIGFWSASWLLETLRARKSAALLSLAGSLSALATAASGVADWKGTYGRGRRLGLVHGALNTCALLLQLWAAVARARRKHSRAYFLSTAGLGVATASAYLGGELVFGRGTMVDHDAWVTGPSSWTRVIADSDLAERQPTRVEAEGRALLLYRRGRTVTAMEDACAHAGCSLGGGKVTGEVITCPCHGSQYSLVDGAVLHGPSTFPQLLLEARIRAGQVEVRGRTET